MSKRHDQGGWPDTGFSQRLKEIRFEAGLTQEELAHRAGCNRFTIAKLEAGKQVPAWPLVLKLAEALEKDLTALISDENRKENAGLTTILERLGPAATQLDQNGLCREPERHDPIKELEFAERCNLLEREFQDRSEALRDENSRLRLELECDRNRLNAEIASLRARNQELDAAVREMDGVMARHRAEIALERAHLDRIRDELELDKDRLQAQPEVKGGKGAKIEAPISRPQAKKGTAAANDISSRTPAPTLMISAMDPLVPRPSAKGPMLIAHPIAPAEKKKPNAT